MAYTGGGRGRGLALLNKKLAHETPPNSRFHCFQPSTVGRRGHINFQNENRTTGWRLMVERIFLNETKGESQRGAMPRLAASSAASTRNPSAPQLTSFFRSFRRATMVRSLRSCSA